jgi:hypothetical protein
MSELPGRPNLDRLRRQARELLRAAADGESAALARIRAVSARTSLSAAQLAIAREYGFASCGSGHGGREELAMRFLPRLNPLARTVTLTFTHAAEQATIELQLP